MSETPRETIVFSEPGEHTWTPPEWVVKCRVHIKGADAGTPDGPGEPGYVIIELYDK